MELGLVGIVGLGLHVGKEVAVRRADWVVIGHRTVPCKDLVYQLLPVKRVFQRKAHIVVAEGCSAGIHREDVMRISRDRQDLGHAAAFQQADRGRIDLIDGIYLARHQRVQARSRVEDRQQHDLVEMRAVRLPVIRIAVQRCLHARLVAFDNVATAAVCRGRVDLAIRAGHDRQVIVRHQIGEIGIRRVQRDDDILPVDLDVGDGVKIGLHGRCRRFAAVMVERGDHIIGGQRLAGVEGYALADLEDPGRAIRRLPAFGDLGHKIAVGRNLDQLVVARGGEGLDVKLIPQAGIVAVCRGTVADTDAEDSAFLRLCLRQGHAGGQDKPCGGHSHPALEQAAAGHPARKLRVRHGFPPL